MAIKKGSMREVINEFFTILRNDKVLMRLLWYFPEEITDVDPLDKTLPEITDLAEYWDIVNQRIMLAEKVDDLEENPVCRLYISSGRRRGVFNNYLLATQEINITIYVHEDYESDMRSEWISDRINELIALEHVQGSIGRIDYVAGNARVAPIKYTRYDHIYEFVTGKK